MLLTLCWARILALRLAKAYAISAGLSRLFVFTVLAFQALPCS
jgi:hypothetical protein